MSEEEGRIFKSPQFKKNASIRDQRNLAAFSERVQEIAEELGVSYYAVIAGMPIDDENGGSHSTFSKGEPFPLLVCAYELSHLLVNSVSEEPMVRLQAAMEAQRLSVIRLNDAFGGGDDAEEEENSD